MSYKLQHAKWKPNYHALSIWECIGELSDAQHGSNGLHPPRAAPAQLHGWYVEAVEEANKAIEKMIRETTP